MKITTNTSNMYLRPERIKKSTIHICIAIITVVCVVCAVSTILTGSIFAFIPVFAFASQLPRMIAIDVHHAGYGGFIYDNMDITCKKKVKCDYDCTLTSEEKSNLLGFIEQQVPTEPHEDTIHFLNKCYCIGYENRVATFISNTNGDTYILKLSTDKEIPIGTKLYMIGYHCFLADYLNSINYDFGKFYVDKYKYEVTHKGKVLMQNTQ